MPNTTTNFGFLLPIVDSATDEDLWGGQLNSNWMEADDILLTRPADYDFANFKIISPQIIDASATVNALGNISGAVAIDYEDGHYVTGTATGNITSVTISNWPSSGQLGDLTFRITQDGTGGRTIALSSAYLTPDNQAIALTAGANAIDELYFRTIDGGTTILTNANYDYS